MSDSSLVPSLHSRYEDFLSVPPKFTAFGIMPIDYQQHHCRVMTSVLDSQHLFRFGLAPISSSTQNISASQTTFVPLLRSSSTNGPEIDAAHSYRASGAGRRLGRRYAANTPVPSCLSRLPLLFPTAENDHHLELSTPLEGVFMMNTAHNIRDIHPRSPLRVSIYMQ
ncbi:hypothetical protein Hypma_004619 [Hypsizygus marmoreus]|uniref:Uncharacterized protein n=1 Tax=Hypsizygus marmoreus TaxID=39966 RepID=A0A369K317_HYPMA|nr:hypothetical protein Hypma_004619 [Hypsizygus marmoreus]